MEDDFYSVFCRKLDNNFHSIAVVKATLDSRKILKPRLVNLFPSHKSPLPSAFCYIGGLIVNKVSLIHPLFFGFLTNSLALIADAGHNLSDVLGLLLAWGASWLVRRRPTPRYTYGFRRSSILAALLNASFLLIAMGAIATEAIQRFFHPTPVNGSTVIGVALVGIVINTGNFLRECEQKSCCD
jgi:hypothetical protein